MKSQRDKIRPLVFELTEISVQFSSFTYFNTLRSVKNLPPKSPVNFSFGTNLRKFKLKKFTFVCLFCFVTRMDVFVSPTKRDTE